MRRSRGTHRAFHRCPLMNSNLIAESKLCDVLALCSSEVRECLEAAREGAELSFEQGLLLATAEGATLEALVAVADAMRRSAIGETITYVVNRNINFTNVCFVGCSFCGFGKGPNASDAYSLSADDVVAKHLGPSGVRSQQRGEHPDERRLPRAVRSQQPKDRGLLDVQVDPSKRRGRPKALDHTLDVDSRVRHHSQSPFASVAVRWPRRASSAPTTAVTVTLRGP